MASSSTLLRRARHLSTATSAAAAAATSTTTNATSSATMTISKAKSKLRKEHDTDKALDIYSTVKNNHSTSSPGSTHHAQQITVRRLAKSHRFSDIETLIESHKNDPRITDEHFVSSLIKSYGIAGMFEHALKTYNQMETLKTPRSALSFNALLTASLNSKKFDLAPQLFDEMLERYKFKPDEYSYGILVKSFCDAGKPELGVEKLKELEQKGVRISGVTYTSIIHALYKKGNSTEAERVWDEMVNRGCVVDVAASNVRIMSAVDGDPEIIKGMIEEMSNAGLKPDTISYNYLMTCYCKKGMMDEAKEVYDKLEENCCNPNAATFRTLVYYLCRNERFETGYKVFKQSVAVNKIPDFNTLKYLVSGLAKKSKNKEAKGIIRTMKKKFPPNLLVAWSKLEKELGLASSETEAAK
ncbi:putative tetratricopeptide-like helical domain superfamily [Helianthus annuus]|nr:putative tetratricopeptide-like helical domain superfamily [Helianthus annuus]KAJ0659799.1 putative tetratricopeptide-like helical domain superfamily [Helianthus annuus]KAJ0840180.1 putative tetratricopeptide-like helical domain superfamily [Helianthus annuus]KAJ0853555.1 putative tetratricopeptide-like helical domain superfamily [Helianthus annuus]